MFLGIAIRPVVATNMLDNGAPLKPLYMFTSVALVSFVTTIFSDLTHTRNVTGEMSINLYYFR